MQVSRDASHVLPRLWVFALLACCVLFGPADAAEITYVYDALGRLVAVVDLASDTAVYQYDAVGNLLAISRQSSSLVSVVEFTPRSGAIGTAVIIFGTGFSTTPAQNTVTFNGLPGTVTSSTATQIVATVPAGATTGPIAVSAPAGSATSGMSFTVTSTTSPTITNFTPAIGAPGSAVTITGTNFEPVPTNNRVNFNLARSVVGSASATTLGATVPAGATSGHLLLATPAGTTQSGGDFFVPPPGFTTGDVVFTGRIAVDGGSLTTTIGPAAKIALVVFDAAPGQQVSLGMTAVSIAQADVTVIRPDGATLITQYTDSTIGRDLHIATLPSTGTYTILIDPRSTYTGNMTLTLSRDLPALPITTTGGSVTLTISRPGQRTPLTFGGTSGQRFSVGLTSATVTSTVKVLSPDGSILASSNVLGWSSLDLPPLPVTGTYTILIDPAQAGTGSLTLTLSEDLSGTIGIGGSSIPLSIARPGQRARLTFGGTAGQRLDLGLTASSINSAVASILDPDGSTLASLTFGTTNTALDTPALPTTGTYTVLIDPSGTSTGHVTLTLSEEVSGSIAPGGAAVAVNIARSGQRARLAFPGMAGQRVSVGLTGVTIGSTTVSIIKSDGSTQSSTTAAFLDPQTLATGGTYAVLLDPGQAYTGNATVTLYDVPADVADSLTMNGSALHVTVTVPGQQALLTFSGTSGQRITVRGANSSIGCLTLYLNDPASGRTSTTPCSASFSLGNTLTQTGTYAIRVDPTGTNIGSADISVTSP